MRSDSTIGPGLFLRSPDGLNSGAEIRISEKYCVVPTFVPLRNNIEV